MIYIIGGNGFVGSAFVRFFIRKKINYQIIDRYNYASFYDKPCNILINANGNSKKYIAERDPLLEFDSSTRSVLTSLTSFNFKHYIYLSSGDVYPEQETPAKTDENLLIDVTRQSRFGLNKYLAEQLVKKYADKWLIIRMGGFVGNGLKKNAIYDILNNSEIWISPESELQFINSDSAVEIIWELINKNISNEIINLGGLGVVKIGNIHLKSKSNSIFKKEAPLIRFELNLGKLQSFLSQDLPKSEHEVDKFILKSY
jgi:nucleoside-diphosphate-sugar epimerase